MLAQNTEITSTSAIPVPYLSLALENIGEKFA